MATVVLIGTLDTKAEEYAFVRSTVEEQGCATLLIDVGIEPCSGMAADVNAFEVALAAGTTLEALRQGGDRGQAMAAMARGATAIAGKLYLAGKLQAVMALGGSGGSSVATTAMRALPIGVPKLMVSTVAAGDVSPYVGTSDIMMLYPVIDFAGLNVISERILKNAAVAAAAMAKVASSVGPIEASRPVVAITMFGVTTKAAMAAREYLEKAGYEVLVFHANGTGGRAMEKLVRDGLVSGVLDLTTTELADEVAGGTLSAGPDRLEAAGDRGLPQVVSLGALDMVNFGPMETVPERFRGRHFHRHNANVTLMRTSPAECAAIGAVIATKLNRAKGPVAVFIPTRGVSAIAVPEGPFFDPQADAALIESLRRHLDPRIACTMQDTDINDFAFAREMAAALHRFMMETKKT